MIRTGESSGRGFYVSAASLTEAASKLLHWTCGGTRHGWRSFVPLALLAPSIALAQASPFQTGATALETNLLAILTPVAVILIIGLGIMAMANRIAWGWCIGAIAGVAISFGAPQIVSWIRSMFGV
jgi:type IV secretion system protein VirB2